MYYYCLNKIYQLQSEEIESEKATKVVDKIHKTAFSTLKLKVLKDYTEFEFEKKPVQVLNYLPVQEKEDIIEVAYQKAIVDNVFNPILFNIYFLLNIVYSYTNLTFTDEQRKDEKKLYDMLESSGLLNDILRNIKRTECYFFEQNAVEYISKRQSQDYSVIGLFNNAVGALNTFSKVVSEKLSNVDENTIQNLVDNLPTLIGGNKIEQTK